MARMGKCPLIFWKMGKHVPSVHHSGWTSFATAMTPDSVD